MWFTVRTQRHGLNDLAPSANHPFGKWRTNAAARLDSLGNMGNGEFRKGVPGHSMDIFAFLHLDTLNRPVTIWNPFGIHLEPSPVCRMQNYAELCRTEIGEKTRTERNRCVIPLAWHSLVPAQTWMTWIWHKLSSVIVMLWIFPALCWSFFFSSFCPLSASVSMAHHFSCMDHECWMLLGRILAQAVFQCAPGSVNSVHSAETHFTRPQVPFLMLKP